MPAGTYLGISWQLPVLNLRSMHGHRIRHARILRYESHLRVPATGRTITLICDRHEIVVNSDVEILAAVIHALKTCT